MENDNIVILNPSLDDLMNDNIYMLEFEREKYYVPLWHDELYYKHNNNDLVIRCIPELPENISLDDNNNILIHIYESISNIINQEYIQFPIGTKTFYIPVTELKIRKTQKHIIKNKEFPLFTPIMYMTIVKNRILSL